MQRNNLDSKLPKTIQDVVALLQRRIEVHEAWRNYILSKPEEAKKSVDAGVGTLASHQIYADQYRAAINIIRG